MNARNSGSLRLFFALWPDDATASALLQLQASIQGKKVPYANLHMTLAFLGQQPLAVLPRLKDILARLPRTDILLTLDRVGYFPRNRIAWAGPRRIPAELGALHEQLVQALADRQVAFDREHRYTPHVTLARDAALPPDLFFDPIVWRATKVALVQSTSAAEGPLYTILASRAIDQDGWEPDESGGENIDAPRAR